jgi:hypothetical protein
MIILGFVWIFRFGEPIEKLRRKYIFIPTKHVTFAEKKDGIQSEGST